MHSILLKQHLTKMLDIQASIDLTTKTNEIRIWCEEQFGKSYIDRKWMWKMTYRSCWDKDKDCWYEYPVFHFKDKDYAIVFALRWA